MSTLKNEVEHDCLREAAEAHSCGVEAVLPKMKYCDMHCDALTSEGVLQVNKERLVKGECLLQCYAAFIKAREGRFSAAISLADQFDALCKRENYHPVRSFCDIRSDSVNALLTIEEGGAIEGDIEKLEALYRRGVRLMTLTWNYPNEIGYPNFPDYEGLKTGRSSPYAREKVHGLTDFGRQTVERMCELGMIVDVSHGSDRLVTDVAEICRRRGVPFTASHSGAAVICPWARNLEDEQIRLIAECGGIIGLDFCADFTSPDGSAEGQREALLAHARHIIQVGGEDILALGSDFDGIPPNPYLPDPSYMPTFLEMLEKTFGERVAEKIASKNALRLFREVL